MTDVTVPTRRKVRIDGQRNRALILEVAKRVLVAKGVAASMEEIALAAGVGNGTLYRHFPTKTALVEAVCREDTRELIEAATRLADTHTPLEAIRAWLNVFVDYVATKHIIAEATSALVSPSADFAQSSSADVRASLTMLFDRVTADGRVGGEFDPLDLMRAVAGVGAIGPQSNWEQHARRLIDVLVAGLGSK